MRPFRVVPLGDSCLSLEFDARIDPAINAQSIAAAGLIAERRLAGIRDIVPGFHTVAVHFDARLMRRETLGTTLEEIGGIHMTASDQAPDLVQIPVSYGGRGGQDLAAVAAHARCSEAEVVRIHTATEYRVYMLGFLPGFAYLGIVDRQIAMPRLEIPRLRVDAGSVGIAGQQTAIYPCETPGGWRIIGRTEIRPFDTTRVRPFLFTPGQRVKFLAL